MESVDSSPYLRFIQKTGSTRHLRGFLATDILLKRMKLTNAQRILDVGCGAGHTTSYIAKNYDCSVTGVDISAEVLERAVEFYKDEPHYQKMNFLVGSATKLPFADQSFDAVLCESVLFFVADKQAAIHEMGRVVKPNGYLALNEVCINADEEWQNIRDYFHRKEFGGHITTASALISCLPNKEWRSLLQDEEPLDIKNQFKTDVMGLLSIKGVLQLFEMIYRLFNDADVRSDLLRVLAFVLELPKDALKQLTSLLLLAQKRTL
jgi:ubiquinone/menaquinone biosynthesis C-methylase UbiE